MFQFWLVDSHLKQISFDLAIVNSISFFNYHFIYTRDEAEMEYLKIAQDLEMYGVSYFEIKVLWLLRTVSPSERVL